jgi:hypothetical protein
VGGTELEGQGLLLRAPGDGHGPHPHLGGELDPEVPEAPDAQHGDQVARPGVAVAEGVVGGDAGAHQRCGLHGRELLGEAGQGVGGDHHGVGVPAVVGDARDLQGGAVDQVPAPAGLAPAAVTPEPADADPLTGFPADDPRARGLHHAGHLVTGDAGEPDAGEEALLGHGVAVADPARLDPHPHLAGSRLGGLAVDQLEGGTSFGDLHRAYGVHVVSPPSGSAARRVAPGP